MKLLFRYSIFCIILLGFSPMTGVAQRGYTMNFLDLVPQQNKYNPAYEMRYNSYVGFPMLSGIQLQVNNDAFSISRTFQQKTDTSNKDLNPLGIIASASENNNLGIDFSLDIFSFGFKAGKKGQIHVGLGVEGYANLLLTRNTLSFIFAGPGTFIGRDGLDALSGNQIDLSAYGAFSLGYSREINEKFRVGGRVKFLSGLANVYTERSEVSVFIDDGDPDVTPYTYTVKPNIVLNGSFSGAPEDSNLLYAMRNLGSSIDMSGLGKNLGIGFDIGAVYQVDEDLKVAASIYDIGFINWSTGVKRITSQGRERPFVFEGVKEINDILKDEEFDVMNVLNSLADSLTDFFQLNEVDSTFTSYRSSLRTSYNLSLFYNFTDNDQIGLMWNSQLGRRKYNAFTIAYTRTFGRNFQVCVNNAIINDNFFNFGGGFAVNAGPLQFYLIADKISSFRVIDMRAVNIQFGLNLVFSRKKMRDFTPRDRSGYVNDRWAW